MLPGIFFQSVIQLWQQFVSYKFEMLICVTATMSSGENEVVVYVFLHRVPHTSFGQENGKENGEGKKKKRMYRCTYKFDFIRTLVKYFNRESGIFPHTHPRKEISNGKDGTASLKVSCEKVFLFLFCSIRLCLCPVSFPFWPAAFF